jgi:hypothetical protein
MFNMPSDSFEISVPLKGIGHQSMRALPGWISHWKEIAETPKRKLHRPRQIYVGNTERKYAPIAQRG